MRRAGLAGGWGVIKRLRGDGAGWEGAARGRRGACAGHARRRAREEAGGGAPAQYKEVGGVPPSTCVGRGRAARMRAVGRAL